MYEQPLVKPEKPLRDFVKSHLIDEKDHHPQAKAVLDRGIRDVANVEMQVEGAFPIRCPRTTDDGYVANDTELGNSYGIAKIGYSGWSWGVKTSVWIGIDIDSAANHAVGLDDDTVQRYIDAFSKHPSVELTKSKSGKGIHARVLCNLPADTRRDHIDNAKRIAKQLEEEIGLPLGQESDVIGVMLWVWSDDVQEEGLELISPATEEYKLNASVQSLVDEIDWKKLTLGSERTPLDQQHTDLLDSLPNATWNERLGLAQVRTTELERASHRGEFYTATNDEKDGKANAFMFPMPNGGWKVYRHGKNTLEHESWARDGDHTWCYYNTGDYASTCKRFGGWPTDKPNEYCMPDIESTQKVLDVLGVECSLAGLPASQVMLKKEQDRLTVVSKVTADTQLQNGWTRKQGRAIFVASGVFPTVAKSFDGIEKVCRYVLDNGKDYWTYNARERWHRVSKSNLITHMYGVLDAHKKSDIERALSHCTARPWERVYLPFDVEEPEPYKWNLDAPNWNVESVSGTHPNWDRMFQQSGRDLNEAVANDPWCQKHGIEDGAQFLKLWVAIVARMPWQSTPYLFVWSYEEDRGGKSFFIKALRLLWTANAFTEAKQNTFSSSFNSQLKSAVLVNIEEFDLSENVGVSETLKKLVDASYFASEGKGVDAVDSKSHLHFYHSANFPQAVGISEGDTRRIVYRAVPMSSDDIIPEPILIKRLEAEAPAMRHMLENIPIPPAAGRLYLPCLETEAKRRLIAETSKDAWITALADYVSEVGRLSAQTGDLLSLLVNDLHVANAPKNSQGLGQKLMSQQVRAKFATYGVTVQNESFEERRGRVRTRFTFAAKVLKNESAPEFTETV